MMKHKITLRVFIAALLLSFINIVSARDIAIATWNMSWHLSNQEATQWIKECNATFSKDDSGMWRKSSAGEKTGWDLQWRRDAAIEWNIRNTPPCDVYQKDGKIIPVTPSTYKARTQSISNFIVQKIKADVIAFQEVSGEQAIRDILPDSGKDYDICSYRGFTVQRLAFAWKKKLNVKESKCSVYTPLALTNSEKLLRPGLALTLSIDNKKIQFLNVHLKSSCVSFLESKDANGKGQLAGNDPACVLLQEQIKPLEDWIEQESKKNQPMVVLGDFNRNLWHEMNASKDAQIRIPDEDARKPYVAGIKSINLFREINDGIPVESTLKLLDEECDTTFDSTNLCNVAKERVLSRKEQHYLASPDALGCRNAVGVDHILITDNIKSSSQGEKISLGALGGNLSAQLAISDHCPILAKIKI